MDISVLFKAFAVSAMASVGLFLGVAAAHAAGEVKLKSEVYCATDLKSEEAKLHGVPREKGRGILFAQVVEVNGKTSKPMHSQIFAGATCKHAGLLSLPLYRTADGRMMADFRHAEGDTCRFLIHAISGDTQLKNDFVYTFPN